METTQHGASHDVSSFQGQAEPYRLGSAPLTIFYDDAPFIGTKLTGAATQTDYRRLTTLLAEDKDDLRLVMGWILGQMGYLVVPCRNGQLASEGISLANRYWPSAHRFGDAWQVGRGTCP